MEHNIDKKLKFSSAKITANVCEFFDNFSQYSAFYYLKIDAKFFQFIYNSFCFQNRRKNIDKHFQKNVKCNDVEQKT